MHINKSIAKHTNYYISIHTIESIIWITNKPWKNCYPKSRFTLYDHCFALFSQIRTLYLNRYLYVLPLVMFSLWRYRLVLFHICKASRRSSKFCLPVADLHLSSFFLPRPPSTTPRSCLSRSSSSSSSSSAFIELSLPRRTHLYLLVLSFDLWVAEN